MTAEDKVNDKINESKGLEVLKNLEKLTKSFWDAVTYVDELNSDDPEIDKFLQELDDAGGLLDKLVIKARKLRNKI